nr:MAG TPA: hypothetical protein [Caudoviricetes sp.]
MIYHKYDSLILSERYYSRRGGKQMANYLMILSVNNLR